MHIAWPGKAGTIIHNCQCEPDRCCSSRKVPRARGGFQALSAYQPAWLVQDAPLCLGSLAVWLWTSSSRLPMKRSSLEVSKLHRGTLDQHSLSSVRCAPHNAQYSRDAQWCNCDCPRDLMPNVPAAMPRWAPLFPRSAEAKKLRTLEVGRGGRARPQGSLPPEIEIVAGLLDSRFGNPRRSSLRHSTAGCDGHEIVFE